MKIEEAQDVEFSLPEFALIAGSFSPYVGALAELLLHHTPDGEAGGLNHLSDTLSGWESRLIEAFDEASEKMKFSELEQKLKALWIVPEKEEVIN